MNKVKKITVWSGVILLVTFLLLPLIIYNYSLGLVDTMPEKSDIQLTEKKVEEIWLTNEKCTAEECASITPYWLYRWLATAIVNDYITPVDLGAAYENTSKMAFQVAIYHLRQGHFKGK